MRCLFGNCRAERDVINRKTQLPYSYCHRHRIYQSLRQKQRRRWSKPVNPLPIIEPIDVILPEPLSDTRTLEQRLVAYHKLFGEIEKVKHRLNALPECTVFTEQYVRDQLCAAVNGQIEHVLPSGDRIDVLTADTIYEVKPPEQYKAAIGQLLVYGQFFPLHRKTLYLTKLGTPRKIATILQDCQRHGIFVQLFVE